MYMNIIKISVVFAKVLIKEIWIIEGQLY